MQLSGQGRPAFSAPPRWITDTPQLPWWRLQMITQERLKELLRYDPINGRFVRIAAPGPRTDLIGTCAGTHDTYGYIQIRIDGILHLAHRLAWLYMTGNLPGFQIDHRNTVRDDNAWSNLRPSTPRLNQQNRRAAAHNNRSGVLGVNEQNGRYWARINVNGKERYLGIFATKSEASDAYIKAKRKFHPGGTL